MGRRRAAATSRAILCRPYAERHFEVAAAELAAAFRAEKLKFKQDVLQAEGTSA